MFVDNRHSQVFWVAFIVAFVVGFYYTYSHEIGKGSLQHLTQQASSRLYGHPHRPPESGTNDKRLAYVTFLSSTVTDATKDFNEDVYFVSTRILVYQLLFANETRSRRNIPIVVLVTPDVDSARRDRLIKDGAIVRPVELITTGQDWIAPGDPRWRAVITKMRLWEMTEYSRIVFLDGDTVLQRPLDGVFDEVNATITDTRTDVPNTVLDRESSSSFSSLLPDRYLLASMGELPGPDHNYPPDWNDFKNPYSFCAGFFVASPSKEMFAYYESLLATPNSFDSVLPEQNLLNHAHRWDGPMPWTEIKSTWNIRSVNENDYEKGVASMHEKWWQDPVSGSKKVKDWFWRARWEMEGYYRARDRCRSKQGC